jgi:transcriptional regulator with XRE-family HTH domain
MPDSNLVVSLLQPRWQKSSYTSVVMNKSGEFLRKRRQELGLTQADVAKRSGLSVSYISTLERGQKHSTTNADLTPARDKVLAIAKALKTDADEMLVLFGFAPEYPIERPKPQNVQELLAALNELGVDAMFYGGVENLPDDPELLADILDDFATVIALRLRKKLPPNNEGTGSGLLPR